MHTLYPFKFAPVFKEKIWGGSKIRNVLGLDTGKLPNCGEAWLMSGVEGSPTLVVNGYLSGNELNELVEVFMGDLVGDKVYERFGDQFPILVKVLDSNDWLSIQVHPDDELAADRGIGFGKTEMWYVMQADENASLISGFNREISREQYVEQFNQGKLRDLLNVEKVAKGDVFYMPAGRVHALGPGCLIAEIQQTSDITYRIYDWDRKDEKGNSRELHTEEALDAIDFNIPDSYKTNYESKSNLPIEIVNSPYFTTRYLQLDKAVLKDYSNLDSFVILMCVEGAFSLKWDHNLIEVKQAEVLLVPAMIDQVELHPQGRAVILEVYIE
ncbi:MAG: mannose-6-phosphate isomerase [Bacteroidales bacterium]|nr:mannose-6-phosphate isomerase [Bacteroidales bacterium]